MFDIVINSFLGEASGVTGCMPNLYKRMGSDGYRSLFVFGCFKRAPGRDFKSQSNFNCMTRCNSGLGCV
jgi:hypothetical protein